MDGFFEKFSIYDFFNLLFGGGVFIIGLHLLQLPLLDFLINGIKIPDNNIITLTLSLSICYLIGLELQGIGHRFEKSCSRKMTESFLRDDSAVIDHEEKLRIYQKKAKELFTKKGIDIKEDHFEKRHCEYFFAHCIYYIQIRDESWKPEKMRSLKGLSRILMTCFACLSLIGVILGIPHLIYKGASLFEFLIIFIMILGFCALSVTNFFRMKQNTRFWIRMVLGLYEACSDQSSN